MVDVILVNQNTDFRFWYKPTNISGVDQTIASIPVFNWNLSYRLRKDKTPRKNSVIAEYELRNILPDVIPLLISLLLIGS